MRGIRAAGGSRLYTLLALIVIMLGASICLTLIRIGSTEQLPNVRRLLPEGERVVVRELLEEGNIMTNSRFRVTRTSPHYKVQTDLTCFIEGCRSRNNLAAYRSCEDEEAKEWLVLGVRSMERYVTHDIHDPPNYAQRHLIDATNFFKNATARDPQCAQAHINLGLTLLKQQQYQLARDEFLKALELVEDPKEKAIIHVFAGLNEELHSDRVKAAREHYDLVRSLAPEVEKQWWGIPVTQGDRTELRHFGNKEMPESLVDFALYKYFSPTAISSYALLPPGTQDSFISESYGVVRKILPPFVLSAMQRCYRNLIDKKYLVYGDSQAKRYVAYNDRCGRFIQYHLTDLIKTIIAHNAKPTYSYFGGYRAGSELKPHVDRKQCEFTLSLTIEQSPPNSPWGLALIDFHKKEVVADLQNGDGLLFMGRILKHYRKGILPEGHMTNQIFLHYVNADFEGSLN